MSKKLSIKDITSIGIFTALIIVIGQITIPMPYGVPMTLQTFIIPLAGIILGTKKGFISTLLYVLLGLVGLPVFAGLTGGVNIVLGPTGGFIVSFPIMALLTGIGYKKGKTSDKILGILLGTVINYIFGMIVFSIVTSSNLQTAFIACVLPFIPTTIIKMIFIYIIGDKVRVSLLKEKLI